MGRAVIRAALAGCFLLGGAATAGENPTTVKHAVRLVRKTGSEAVVRHVFSDAEWTVPRRWVREPCFLLHVDGDRAVKAERLVGYLFGCNQQFETCHVWSAYLVPKDRRADRRWRKRVAEAIEKNCEFWEEQLCGRVRFRPYKSPHMVRGNRTEEEYRKARAGFWKAIVSEAEQRLSFPRTKRKGIREVLVVFAVAVDKGGGGSAAAALDHHGVALISGEVLPFLYLDGEDHPETVVDPLRGGNVPWDWGLGVVVHEFGHTIGFPHPVPLDGSVMGGGWLSGLRRSKLAEHQQRLVLEPAENTGYLTRWRVSEPFPGREAGPAPPRSARWHDCETDHPRIPLSKLFPARQNVHVFARTWFELDAPAKGELLVGSDDTVRVSVNGELVFNSIRPRGWVLDADRIDVTFRKGWNELLVGCGNGTGGWAFSVRVRLEGEARPRRLRSSHAPPSLARGS